MKLQFLKKLGDGAFADVWQARDELGRDVAVKIVREANLGVADALDHAKALARARHPNVVSVLTLEVTGDPQSGEQVDCVVMELIDGVTLADRVRVGKLTAGEVASIGSGIIDGVAHIHAQGIAHGDLHSENVMVIGESAKIIDILYLNSLATLATERRESRLKRDILSLRLLIQELIVNSEIDSAEATEFNNLLDVDANFYDIRVALLGITNPDTAHRNVRALEHMFLRLIDADFIEGEAYAAALDEVTPTPVILPLLKKVADEKVYETKHSGYVQAVWSRLTQPQRAELLAHISEIIDSETPKGKWWPGIRFISALRPDGWAGLSTIVQVRLEGLITKDVLAGRTDIHSTMRLSGGTLGTYANGLWKHFKKPEILADNLISLLRQSWFTQNYVGSFFMKSIPLIANATNKRLEFICAFRIAVANDARIVVNKLEELPEDWVNEIRTA